MAQTDSAGFRLTDITAIVAALSLPLSLFVSVDHLAGCGERPVFWFLIAALLIWALWTLVALWKRSFFGRWKVPGIVLVVLCLGLVYDKLIFKSIVVLGPSIARGNHGVMEGKMRNINMATSKIVLYAANHDHYWLATEGDVVVVGDRWHGEIRLGDEFPEISHTDLRPRYEVFAVVLPKGKVTPVGDKGGAIAATSPDAFDEQLKARLGVGTTRSNGFIVQRDDVPYGPAYTITDDRGPLWPEKCAAPSSCLYHALSPITVSMQDGTEPVVEAWRESAPFLGNAERKVVSGFPRYEFTFQPSDCPFEVKVGRRKDSPQSSIWIMPPLAAPIIPPVPGIR